MSKIILYQFPGACSRVTMTALEEIGMDYEDRMVNIRIEGQKSPEYLTINPKAKVPALVIHGQVMTENAAILAYLDEQHPAATLLPKHRDPVREFRGLIDLIWCSSTLHPMVRQVRAPHKLTTRDPSGVKADGIEKFSKECRSFSIRLANSEWWYGGNWSILDVYLYWAYSTAEKGGFSLDEFPVLVEHAIRVRDWPSFRRALKREQVAAEKAGIEMPAGEWK